MDLAAVNCRAPRPDRGPARGGFTLLELLAVISILAVLMGVGAGVFSQVNVSKFTALGTVRSVLRSARENALAGGLPVSVVCDGAENRIYDLSVRPFGFWSFEDESGASDGPRASFGAFGLDAVLYGARIREPGRTGASLHCTEPRDHALAPLGERAVQMFKDGIAAELDVFVERPHDTVLLRRGRQFLVRALEGGTLEAEVGLADDEGPGARAAGRLVVTSKPGVLLPGRWLHVAFVYDRQALTLLADGVVVATREARDPVIHDAAPLEFGDRAQVFAGRLDSVKLGFVAAGEGQRLPKQVSFVAGPKPIVVHFAGDGRLDPAWHRAEALLVLRFPENVRKEVRIGSYGIVR